MNRDINILTQTLIRQFYLFIILFIFSCSQNNTQQPDASGKKDTWKPPATITIKAPVVTRLDTCPKPRTIAIPGKPGGSYFLKTETVPKKIPLLPPETKPTDIFVPMQNYDTEQGLALSAVKGSCMDKRGNLWFCTLGGGVSRYDGKSFTNYTTVQGLANNDVRNIVEDKSGNLWFATGHGISQYDGRSFKSYTTAQGLADNYVWTIFEDKKGNLWFGTTHGVSRLDRDRETFTTYTSDQGLALNSVLSIIGDKNGNLWFGTFGGGVSRYDGKVFTNYTTSQGLASNYVNNILEDKNGNLWFGTESGVSRYDSEIFTTYTTAPGLANNYIASILEDKTGSLWFGTWGAGVVRLDRDGKSFTSYTTVQGLANNNVQSILEDKNGNLWFGTDGGISRLDRNLKSMLTEQAGTTNYDIVTLLEDKSGNLWIGTWGGGVTRLDRSGKFYTSYTTAQGLANNIIVSLFEDKSGNLWMGTWGGGVSRLGRDGKSFTSYTTDQGLADNTIKSILEDKGGNLWFGSLVGKVSRLNQDRKSFTSYTLAQGVASTHIESILQDKRGNTWFGTFEGGVFRLDRDGNSFTSYTTAQGLAGNTVWNILEDKNGNLWFGTDAGLSRYDGKIFRTYSTNEGLGDDMIHDIVMDKQGIIWLGTNKGFTALKGFAQDVKYSPDREGNLEASNKLSNFELETGDFKPVFEIYNNKTGYPIKQASTMCVTREGIIWAGTGDKLVRFDYSGIHKNPNEPDVFIQSVKINNENICWYDLGNSELKTDSLKLEDSAITPANIVEEATLFGKPLSEAQRDSVRKKYSDVKFDSITRFYPVPVNLVLPYRHNNITFDFAAIEPARPKLVRYQYMLKGYDKEWNPVTDKTTASFGNIREGNYTFRLKAQSPDGVWSKPIVYTFKVFPPWYRTWWAYTLYLLVFLTALWIFIRLRVKTLKREKTILEEKVAIRTHQLKAEKEKVESTLMQLKATQTQLIQSEKMASLGELTAGIAHEIQNPLNFVNNFSEVNKELLVEMKDEIDKGNINDAKAIANDLIDNEEKINHHGRRADAIVKGMLQHSQVSTGQKEPTDINALCDEYLRLSYLGLRAKDKNFNADIKTDFDESIGKIDIVPQDIGRVLLNLYNNAFFAVAEKNASINSAQVASTNSAGQQYEPTVSPGFREQILIYQKSGFYLR